MSFAKPLSATRSEPQTQLPVPHDQDAQRQIPRTIIPTVISRLAFETLGRFATCAGTSFPNVLGTILLWVIGEFLAGCAAHAQALYAVPDMVPAPAADHAKSRGPAASASQLSGKTVPRARPSLRVIGGTAAGCLERRELLPVPERSQSNLAQAQACRDHLGQPQLPPRCVPSGWYVSISAAAMAWLAEIRQARARHRAALELTNFDDRSLRDIGLCRYDVESAVRRGRWWG